MRELTFFVLDNGRLPEGVKATLANIIPSFAGKKVTLTIAEAKEKRSCKQNRFYFGVVIPAVREWFLEHGYNFDAEEVHDYLVRRVWKHTETVFLDYEPFERRLSSTKLSTAEWEQRIELVRIWGADKGLIIPFPNEGDYE